ncbi:MAG: TIGR00730 family Rossman fold protein [Anaerolineae bacterium]
MKRICIFCGSSNNVREVYKEAAWEIGTLIAHRGYELIYGGGRAGLMGTVADAALHAGGTVIGVIPTALVQKETQHNGLTQLHVVNSMHERKAMMADLTDSFIALPGGFGTLDEFCEIITWAQLGYHRKPVSMLNTDGFYNKFLDFLDFTITQGFIRAEHRALLLIDEQPVRLLDRLAVYQPPLMDKWLKRENL